jgi:hypothetical protein
MGICGKHRNMKRMHILIEFDSKDEKLYSEILHAPEKLDAKTDLPASAVIMKVNETKEGKELFRLGFGDGISPARLANWLYKKIQGRATKLLLDRKEVEIDKTEIERIFSDKMKNE